MKRRKKTCEKKSVSSLWLQSCRRAGLSRFRHVRSKLNQFWHRQTKMSGIQKRQHQARSTVASSNKDVGNSDTSNASPIYCGIVKQRCREFGHVEDKDFPRIAQSTAVPARGSAAAPIGFPLSVQGPSPSRNFRHPACPGSTCLSELKRAL